MATYKTSELLKQLCDLVNDGYAYVDVSEIEADEDFPASLSFSICEGFAGMNYCDIDSCDPPENYLASSCDENPDDSFARILFSEKELCTIACAIDNALEYFKELKGDPNIPQEDRDGLRILSTDCRNLQAKLKKFFY